MSSERLSKLSAVYSEPGKAEKLFNLGIDGAVAALADEGYDFTAEEVRDFYSWLDENSASFSAEGELDESALEDVAGGVVGLVVTAIAASYIAYTANNGYLSNPSKYPPWSTKRKK